MNELKFERSRHEFPAANVARTLRNLEALMVRNSNIIASRGWYLYESSDDGKSWRKRPLGLGCMSRLRATSPLSRRLFRTMVGGMYQSCSNGAYYWIADGVLFKSVNGLKPKPIWAVENGRRPLSQGICFARDSILIGEYWTNPERREVRIHQIDAYTDAHSVFHEFPAGSIRHVHAVQVDPFTSEIWIATGDEDHECQVGILEDGSVSVIGQGSQDWRVVGLAFTKDAVYWGTDDPYRNNVIYRWDRRTRSRTVIGQTIGPVYYAVTNGRYIVFSTAVEMGRGYHDGFARIYAYDTVTTRFGEVYRAKKDMWSPKYFGYGVIEFARQRIPFESFWAVLRGLRGGTRSIELRLST